MDELLSSSLWPVSHVLLFVKNIVVLFYAVLGKSTQFILLFLLSLPTRLLKPGTISWASFASFLVKYEGNHRWCFFLTFSSLTVLQSSFLLIHTGILHSGTHEIFGSSLWPVSHLLLFVKTLGKKPKMHKLFSLCFP